MHRNLCAIWKRQRIQDLQGHTKRGRFSLSRSLDRAGHSSVISVHNSGEMVVSLSLCDQILGQLALRQQGIGAHILPLNINGIQ